MSYFRITTKDGRTLDGQLTADSKETAAKLLAKLNSIRSVVKTPPEDRPKFDLQEVEALAKRHPRAEAHFAQVTREVGGEVRVSVTVADITGFEPQAFDDTLVGFADGSEDLRFGRAETPELLELARTFQDNMASVHQVENPRRIEVTIVAKDQGKYGIDYTLRFSIR